MPWRLRSAVGAGTVRCAEPVLRDVPAREGEGERAGVRALLESGTIEAREALRGMQACGERSESSAGAQMGAGQSSSASRTAENGGGSAHV